MTRSLGCAPACRHAHGLSNSSPDCLNSPYGEPTFSSPYLIIKNKRHRFGVFFLERMTRSLGCAPACRHAHGLSNSSPDCLNLPYGKPTFSSPYLIIKNKRHRIGVFYFLERMTGLARLRSRLPTRPRSFKQFTGLFEFAFRRTDLFESLSHYKK